VFLKRGINIVSVGMTSFAAAEQKVPHPFDRISPYGTHWTAARREATIAKARAAIRKLRATKAKPGGAKPKSSETQSKSNIPVFQRLTSETGFFSASLPGRGSASALLAKLRDSASICVRTRFILANSFSRAAAS
jgi:hypothetical protein